MGRPKKNWVGSICKNSECGATDQPLTQQGECRKCYHKAIDKANYDKDPQAHIAKVLAWKAKNPDKVKLNKHLSYLRHRDEILAKTSEWARNNRPKVNAAHRRKYVRNKPKQIEKKYAMADGQYLEMFDAQGGKCAVCNIDGLLHDTNRRAMLVVDHDHATGKVRRLLCSNCNITLSTLENSQYVAKLLEYLKEHASPPTQSE